MVFSDMIAFVYVNPGNLSAGGKSQFRAATGLDAARPGVGDATSDRTPVNGTHHNRHRTGPVIIEDGSRYS